MSDFIEASKAYWKQYQKGDKEYKEWAQRARTGNIIPIPEDKVFVFFKDEFQFDNFEDRHVFNGIIERCMAQRAIFHVPYLNDQNAGKKARKHIFGETE